MGKKPLPKPAKKNLDFYIDLRDYLAVLNLFIAIYIGRKSQKSI